MDMVNSPEAQCEHTIGRSDGKDNRTLFIPDLIIYTGKVDQGHHRERKLVMGFKEK